VILVVAATERELAASGAPDTFCCGIGPAEAGIRTAMGLIELRPDAVLHVGIAGAPELEPLSVVIGSEAHYADIVDPSSLMPKVERAYPAPGLVEAAQRALPDAQVLPIASCARVGGGGECHVEAMEGFSVLRAAELAGVPAVEVRTISNRPAESDRGLWRIDDALARLGEIVPSLLEELAPCVR
jgi:nucleoside phosphorylase